MTRLLALVLAYFFLALAILGIFLPVLPTVPFLLLTTWFAARGSDHLHSWLYDHPYLGKLLIDWEQQGAISNSNKITAVLMLMISWFIIYYRLDNIWWLTGITALFVSIALYLITRPKPCSK